MARVKISEYDAKRLLLPALHHKFSGFSATSATTVKELTQHFPETNLVVKVDQGIKKRGKQGLVKVNATPKEVIAAMKSWSKQGWSHFLVEPVIEHSEDAERYLALERMRDGWQLSWGEVGGIEVESSWESVSTVLVPDSSDLSAIRSAVKDRSELSALTASLTNLIPAMEKHHIIFLEMNPVLVRGSKLIPLDMAAEIDDMALGLPELAARNLISVEEQGKSAVEQAVAKLDAATPASLKFRLINRNGAIWMLLSGGGASLVLADEVADQGMGEQLANYGEYSGAPTDDDVYAYTKLVLSSLLKSAASKKVVVIAGGVANFTDVVKTFRGIIRALDEQKSELLKARVKVFVRRGGPNEAKGLTSMHTFLKGSKLLGSVHGHDTPLTQVVGEVKDYL